LLHPEKKSQRLGERKGEYLTVEKSKAMQLQLSGMQNIKVQLLIVDASPYFHKEIVHKKVIAMVMNSFI